MNIENLTQKQKSLLDNISYNKEYICKSKMTYGNAYKITLEKDNKKIYFIFNDNAYNESDKNDALYSLLSDSQAYTDALNLDDFMSCFGYDDHKQAKQIYNACKEQNKKLKYLFNNDEIETLNKIFENY